MSFHLRVTLQRQFPWVQVDCTNSPEEFPVPEVLSTSKMLSSEMLSRSESLHPDDFLPNDSAVQYAKRREEEIREYRRWLAILKRASRELRLSEEVDGQRGCSVSARCKAESAEELEASINKTEDYLAQMEDCLPQSDPE